MGLFTLGLVPFFSPDFCIKKLERDRNRNNLGEINFRSMTGNVFRQPKYVLLPSEYVFPRESENLKVADPRAVIQES